MTADAFPLSRPAAPAMQPLAEMPASALARVEAVLTDIDDTLTVDGTLPAAAYQALESLRNAGLRVVPVTGRPAGWCDMIARLWPVDGVVGENGAFTFRYDARTRQMIRRYAVPAEDRAAHRAGLEAIRQRVLAEVPGCAVASDQSYREADLAIDFAEDVVPLPETEVARIVAAFTEAGAQAKVSSIHVNGWFGSYDKLGMTRRLLTEDFGLDVDRTEVNPRVIFVGDSPNDAPMFGFFDNSIGVANFARFAGAAEHLPRWLTRRNGGHGFAEVAHAILEAKAGSARGR